MTAFHHLSLLLLLLLVNFGTGFILHHKFRFHSTHDNNRVTLFEQKPNPTTTTTTTSNSESPQERILSWASSNQAHSPTTCIIHPSLCVKIRPPSEGGAGLFASHSILSGEIVATLPLNNNNNNNEEEEDGGGGLFKFDAVTALNANVLGNGPVQTRIASLISDGSGGSMLAALTGALAHLHLTRLTGNQDEDEDEDDTSFSFGPFLEVLPLLPNNNHNHPFPSHVLFWSDEEISNLLQGLIAQTRARWIRASAGEAVGLLSTAFVLEHCPNKTTDEIIAARDAIVSAFGCTQSRSFEVGDETQSGMLISLLDLLNHGRGYSRNVLRTIGRGDGDGDDYDDYEAVLTAARDIEAGEELLTDYGVRPVWDWGTEYGFVPRDNDDDDDDDASSIVDAAGVPLFPSVVKRKDGTDLRLTSGGQDGSEAVGYVQAALVSAGFEMVEMLDLFLPLNVFGGEGQVTFTPRQPCVVVKRAAATTNDHDDDDDNWRKDMWYQALPAFRAAACVLSELQKGRTPDHKQVECAVANTNDNEAAVALMLENMRDRVHNMRSDGEAADAWVLSDDDSLDEEGHHRQDRLDLARAMRLAELEVLQEGITVMTSFFNED